MKKILIVFACIIPTTLLGMDVHAEGKINNSAEKDSIAIHQSGNGSITINVIRGEFDGRYNGLQLRFEVLFKRYNQKNFEILNDGDKLYSEKDEYIILVHPLLEGYLYVLQQDSKKNISQLYPKGELDISSGNNPVASNMTIQIPPPSDNHSLNSLYLDNTTGLESIYIIFSRSKSELLQKARKDPDSLSTFKTRTSDDCLKDRAPGGIRQTKLPADQNDAIRAVLSTQGRVYKVDPTSASISQNISTGSEPILVIRRWFCHL